MSESTRGDGEQRSWWEKPDQPDPDRDTPAGQQGGSHPAPPPSAQQDPYRGPEQGWDAAPAPNQQWGSAPGQDLPAYGQPQGQPPHEQSPYGQGHQYGQGQPYGQGQQYGQGQSPYEQSPYGQQHQYGQQGQHGGYGQQGYAPGAYPQNQAYAPAGGFGPPVAGQAQAVMWTGIGSIPLALFTGLGFIAAIVALVMAPGARRQVLESHGHLRGLEQIKTGKICAWITIALTVLAVVGFILFFIFIFAAAESSTSGSQFDWESTSIVLAG